MKTLKDMSRAGVTLVELLVVILIVTILAVTMIPMFQKYVTKAQYAAEPIPLVGHLKTQVDLYLYEHSCVPGTNDTVYTWVRDTTSGFTAVDYDATAAKAASSTFQATKPHVSAPLEIAPADMMGKRIAPQHVFYACINTGKPVANRSDPAATAIGGDYGYAIGVFGDAYGLPKNTGYAVMELMCSSIEVGTTVLDPDDATKNRAEKGLKVIGTWENYSATGVEAANVATFGQIHFQAVGGTQAEAGTCAIPTSAYFNVNLNGAADIGTLKDNLDNFNLNGCGNWTFSDLENVNKTATDDNG